ncbi:MAG: hypothetical protein AAF355_00310 [Myxococcota bacterium]
MTLDSVLARRRRLVASINIEINLAEGPEHRTQRARQAPLSSGGFKTGAQQPMT